MKCIFTALLLAVLLFMAAYVILGVGIGLLLWMFVLGDTHEAVWAGLPWIIAALALLPAAFFLHRDVVNRASRRNRIVRAALSSAILLVVLAGAVQGQLRDFAGWTSEEAARNVAALRLPEARNRFTIVEEERRDIRALTRGPYVVYLVKDGSKNICRVGLLQHYGTWWTCGMREFFQ